MTYAESVKRPADEKRPRIHRPRYERVDRYGMSASDYEALAASLDRQLAMVFDGMNKYAAVIYDDMNVVVRVEERPTAERAKTAGEFFTKRSGWYRVVSGADEIELSKSLINA